ncbi:MAG: MFS transporter [Nanoarchaeota archaeon]
MSYGSNIWKFYLISIFSAFELTIAIFVLFLLANNLSMGQVMILETIFIVLVFLLEVPSGGFADLVGRKISVSVSLMSITVAFLLFGLGNSIWMFLLAQVCVAFSWSFKSGAGSALLYDSLKEMKSLKNYPAIRGRASFLSLATWAVSSIISGVLAYYLGYRPLFFITAFIFFIGFLVSLTLREPPIHKHVRKSRYWQHLKAAVHFAVTHPVVRNLVVYYAVFSALGHLAWFFIQPFYKGSPAYLIGFATFLYFGSAAVGNLSAGYFVKYQERPLLILLLIIAGISFLSIPLGPAIYALIGISIMSYTCGLRDVIVDAGVNHHTDSHHRATVMSVQSMGKSIMYAMFAPLLGYVTDLWSAGASFAIMGAALIIFGGIFWIVSSQRRWEATARL